MYFCSVKTTEDSFVNFTFDPDCLLCSLKFLLLCCLVCQLLQLSVLPLCVQETQSSEMRLAEIYVQRLIYSLSHTQLLQSCRYCKQV